MTFWDIMWFIFVSYMLFAYLLVLFAIYRDLFRDRDTSGVTKAVWVVALILFPFLSVVVYLITRGSAMPDREAGLSPGSRVIA